MDARYLVSAAPERGSRVFGFRVFRLTLRHIWALEYLESPFCVGGEIDAEDVVVAARILSARDERELVAVLSPAGWWCRLGATLRGIFYARRQFDQLIKLQDFFAREMLTPKMLSRGPGGKSYSSPWLQVMLSRVARETGQSIEAAWWTRFSDAAWAGVTWQELDGADVKLLDEKAIAEFVALGWDEDEL